MVNVSEFLEWMAKPLGFHQDSMARRGLGLVIDSQTEAYFVAWCPRNQCGGIYALTTNRWTLITPIAFPDFLELLHADGILPAAARDWQARRWMKSCELAGRQTLLDVDQPEGP